MGASASQSDKRGGRWDLFLEGDALPRLLPHKLTTSDARILRWIKLCLFAPGLIGGTTTVMPVTTAKCCLSALARDLRRPHFPYAETRYSCRLGNT